MFTYTCPECRTELSSENIPSGVVWPCGNCGQRMRVVVRAEKSANASTAIAQPRGRGCGPLLLGVSALTGLLLGGAILLLPSLLEGKLPSSTLSQETVARKDNPAAPKADAERKKDADRKKDAERKTDASPETERTLETDASVKADASGMTSDELYNEMLKSCVWIRTQDANGNVGYGTGSLIDREKQMVLTAQHVANRSKKEIVVFFPIIRDGKLVTESEVYLNDLKKEKPKHAIPADFVYDQATCDLALIHLDRLPVGVKALRLSRRTIRPGQPLHTVGGKPKGNLGVWIYSSGAVRQVSFNTWVYKGQTVERQAEVIASSVATNPGDSGGAVVDSRGYLVGVHTMHADGVLNAGHIHVHEVRRFLRTAYRQKLDKEFPEDSDEDAKTRVVDGVNKSLQKLKAAESETRKEAADDLGKLGPEAQRAAVALLKILREPTEVDAVRRAAKKALREIGPPEHKQFKALKAALQDKRDDAYCKEARRYAALSLDSFPEDKRKEIIELLKNALKDDDAQVRQNAALSLASYGKAGQDAAYAGLVECLRDLEPGVRLAAYNTLKAGGLPDEVDLPEVRELLQGEKDGKKPPSKAYALLIGVKTFDRSGLDELKYTENDVEELGRLLDRPGSPFHGRVRVLTSSRGSKTAADKPTAANIRKALQELTGRRTREETVLVALASHGVELMVPPPGAGARRSTRPEGEASPDDCIYPFFCPSDAQFDVDGTDYATGYNEHLINIKDLMLETLGKCGAGAKLLLMDACREHKKLPASRSLSVDYNKVLIPAGLAAMFSCKSGQLAYESPRLQHGVFFYFVLKGLRGEAKDAVSGKVTWGRLAVYVEEAMQSESKAYTGARLQTPHKFGNVVGASPLLVRLEGSPLAKLVGPLDKGEVHRPQPGGQTERRGIQNSIGMRLMPIPKGTFLMGSPTNAIRGKDEKQHEVVIPADFFMGAHEVTQEQYQTVMGSNPSAYSEGGQQQSAVRSGDTTKFPVESVSWTDADAFCKALSLPLHAPR